MMDWNDIDTVLLDMDGTLLDLSFDNFFWQERVPLKFAERHGIGVDEAKQQLRPWFKRLEGRLEWYCLDYWSDALALDIVGLKSELAGLIAELPHAVAFLEKLRQSRRQVLLVTNAHRGGLALKLEKTGLHRFFDAIVCAHDLGLPKERPEFWAALERQHRFAKARALLVDDNLWVLRSARAFGVAHLLSVSRPDSRLPKRTIVEFRAIEDFRALMAGL